MINKKGEVQDMIWGKLALFLILSVMISARPLNYEFRSVDAKPKRSWVYFRDQHVVKQAYDFSCGSAAVATIFSYFYLVQVSEDDIMTDINRNDAASFLDLQRVVGLRQFKGIGLAVSLSDLMMIKIPVILHLIHKGQDHFSVMKGINSQYVWLADPSWGNRKMTMSRFKQLFKTRDTNDKLGSILMILPKFKDAYPRINQSFFGEVVTTNHLRKDMVLFNRVKPTVFGRYSK